MIKVAKSLHKGEGFKILVIGFKKGMFMKEHKAGVTTKLTVFCGAVVYLEKQKSVRIDTSDEIDIPADVVHSVEAIDDALCLLTQG
jgi:quercetin dioxygenase-like cupin family protein